MTAPINSTPRQDGYHMPAEWEAHTRCWMGFPHRRDIWRSGGIPAMRAFIQVAEAISRFEPVTMGVSQEVYRYAARLIPSPIRVVEISSDDSWYRDTGPTFVVNDQGDVRGVDWMFNSWGGVNGGMNLTWDLDDLVAQKILAMEQIDRYRADFILEGGSIHVDAEGTLLTTEECLLNPNRNPSLSRAQIEQRLQDYLGIRSIIWLERGVYLDETDGHIDNMACFVRPGVVVLAWTDDQSHPQYERSVEAYDRLRSATDANGRALEVHKIHLPNLMIADESMSEGLLFDPDSTQVKVGSPMPASYINFYIANGGVIVPTFNDPHDKDALQTLSDLMPDHEIVSVDGREVLIGGGNIHCITQQQPRGRVQI